MPPPLSVDGQHCLAGGLGHIGNDVGNQGAQELLARAHGSRQRVPGGLEIVGEACEGRRCVRCMPWPRGFPLVPALPSIGSAGTRAPLFADFTGTMAGSDCFNPFVIDSDYLLSSAVLAWGVRASLDSSDSAEPGSPSPSRFCSCCLRSS